MSLSDLLEIQVLDDQVPERASPPLYVQPQQDEALGSWWQRLAGRFGLSAQCLSSAVMGSDLVLTRDWSIRPASDLLALAHDRTGIPMDALRSMTFLDWAGSAHFDEALGRFSGRRYMDGAPKNPTRGLAVCAECLRSDAQLYLRLTWLIGWMAICPIHSKA
ncbi:MAG: TniQ family protein, partial [Proteobacteria bacterium]|nr:TniQ family protein [Pseudomonadota bacterium]